MALPTITKAAIEQKLKYNIAQENARIEAEYQQRLKQEAEQRAREEAEYQARLREAEARDAALNQSLKDGTASKEVQEYYKNANANWQKEKEKLQPQSNTNTITLTVSSGQNLSGLTFIPASQLSGSQTTAGQKSGAYNTYDSANIEHAKQLQQSGNILQKAAASLYLGVDSLAKQYETNIDKNNAYGVAFSQGERADTGDEFKNFWANVSGKLVLTPSNLARSVAAGTLAATDIGTANLNASVEAGKTGNITIYTDTKKKTNEIIIDAGKQAGISLGETLTNPEDLTVLGLTALTGAGISGTARGIAKGVTNTAKGVSVKTITKDTGNITLNTKSGSVIINSGKSISIPIGSKTLTISKGKTTAGGKAIDIKTVNDTGKTTSRLSRAKEIVTKTKNAEDGKIIFTGEKTLTILQSNDRIIGTRTSKGRKTTIKQDNPLTIGADIKTQSIKTKTGSIRQTIKGKKDKSGKIRTSEYIKKSYGTKNIDSQYIKSGGRVRINTRLQKTSKSKKESIKDGISKKRTTNGIIAERERIYLDVNIGNSKNLLPGSTKKAKKQYAIQIKNDELFVLGDRSGLLNTVSYRLGDTAERISKASMKDGSKYIEKETATVKPNVRSKTKSVKITERKPLLIARKSNGTTDSTTRGTLGNSGHSGRKTTNGNSDTKGSKGNNNTNTHKTTNGMVYATKTKTKTNNQNPKPKAKPIQTQQQKVKTGTKQKQTVKQTTDSKQKKKQHISPIATVGGIFSTKQHLKQTTKTTPTNNKTIINIQAYIPNQATKTTSTNRTTTNNNKNSTTNSKTNNTANTTKTKTKTKQKQDEKIKLGLTSSVKQTVKQTPKQERKTDQKLKRTAKPLTAVRKKTKKVLVNLDDDKKRRRKVKPRKQKTAIRKEIVNQFTWIDDNRKAAKERKIIL